VISNTLIDRLFAHAVMKSSYVLLIIGGALLVAGLVISAVSVVAVTQQVLEGGVLIDASLEPNLSYVAVLKELPAGRQLVLSLDAQPRDVPLIATLTDANGDPIGTYNITQTPFTTTAVTTEAGDHTLDIKNAGTSAVRVNGALLNSPVAESGGGVSIDQDPAVQSLVTYGIGVLAGIVLIIAGIVILIIGAIKHFRSRKTPESVPTG
jgi:hypothetical protein